jgi:hypothetical protein
MTFNEFQDFMNKIYMNNFQNCKRDLEISKENHLIDIKKIVKKVSGFIERIPDIMSFPEEKFSSDQKYNNIIYYNENKEYIGTVNQDSDNFERHTPGAFIFCNNEKSLTLVLHEILMAVNNNQFIKFNIITNGRSFEKLMKILDNNPQFSKYISNVCIYCLKIDEYKPFKVKYKILYEIYTDNKTLVNDFIEKLSSREIKPFSLEKLITYENYDQKYKERHHKISKFYGDIDSGVFKRYFYKLKSINEKNDFGNGIIKNLNYDLDQDLDKLNELITQRYSGIHLYKTMNKILLSSDFYEAIAYFTARIMYSLNTYAEKNKKFCTQNQKLYLGIKLPYTCLLQYERAIGKAICFSSFTSTTENEGIARNNAGRNNAKEQNDLHSIFSVVITINNIYKDGYKNVIDINPESKNSDEREYVFQPFSFFRLTNISIDVNNKTADISLDTIGKKEILEEKIREGKEIKINKLDEKDWMLEIRK